MIFLLFKIQFLLDFRYHSFIIFYLKNWAILLKLFVKNDVFAKITEIFHSYNWSSFFIVHKIIKNRVAFFYLITKYKLDLYKIIIYMEKIIYLSHYSSFSSGISVLNLSENLDKSLANLKTEVLKGVWHRPFFAVRLLYSLGLICMRSLKHKKDHILFIFDENAIKYREKITSV